LNNHKNKLSFLIIGLGSIGKRHLRNLAALGIENITVFRRNKEFPTDDDLPRFEIETDLAQALRKKPTAVIIASPTALHIEQAIAVAEAGCHILMEKPISHKIERVNDLLKIVKQKGIIFQTAFQFRFHPVFQQAKQLIDKDAIGKIISVHVHWGEYLPLWHPGEDYRQGYSARQDLGGGVVLTLCHPFDYLRWLVGEIHRVSAMVDKLSDLEIDTEDAAMITLRFESGAIGSVYLDYCERPAQHNLTIIGQDGKITWANSDGIAYIFAGENQMTQKIVPPRKFERNTMFINELSHFIDCINDNQQPVCTLEDGIRALEIALAVKKSSNEKREITLLMPFFGKNINQNLY